MTETLRRIGLSLGADLCWPRLYELLWLRIQDWRREEERGA